MIYLDNSASTGFKPECVINSVANTMRFVSANPGRSGHSLAARAAAIIFAARRSFADFVGCDVQRVIFCSGCTDALNIAILGTVVEGGHVITSAFEHNSILRPLYELKRRGRISLTVLYPDSSGTLSPRSVERAIRFDTYLIALTHVSNVTGATLPIGEVGRLCRRRNILFLVDGAQSVGYTSVDMRSQGIDMLAIAPHKGLHGPQGVGVLCLSERARVLPTRFGGTGTASLNLQMPSELPESLEAGTLPTPAIAGANAAVNWTKQNFFQNQQALADISKYFWEQLKSFGGVKIYTPPGTSNGIFAFNVGELSSAEVSNILSEEYNTCTRSGLHCAPLIHSHYKTTAQGMVRASLSFSTTPSDLRPLLTALSHLQTR